MLASAVETCAGRNVDIDNRSINVDFRTHSMTSRWQKLDSETAAFWKTKEILLSVSDYPSNVLDNYSAQKQNKTKQRRKIDRKEEDNQKSRLDYMANFKRTVDCYLHSSVRRRHHVARFPPLVAECFFQEVGLPSNLPSSSFICHPPCFLIRFALPSAIVRPCHRVWPDCRA